ncbi:GNAT family N-acetyltransferase [Cognatishimia maritima]|uniref:Acetyltransferase (GNAT) family protein n=1 Tax=Cognatishimia maritima TaxID=870908 RepID=A0A1M5IUL4_9RHOB|nr:GNAT family N-acetyltransferase [Cognatishimia maritima]SHG32007.1 Acetyltransferase (GNAT) family protein [Cognatishimia maritima]
MSAALHLAKPEDLKKLMPLVSAFHRELQLGSEETALERALIPLLEGSPYGAVYLLGPARAPMGYVTLTFSWSIELGGMDGFVDEIYLRPAVRGRGIALETLQSLRKVLQSAGVMALHLEVDRENEAAQKLYKRARFELRDRYSLMTLRL